MQPYPYGAPMPTGMPAPPAPGMPYMPGQTQAPGMPQNMPPYNGMPYTGAPAVPGVPAAPGAPMPQMVPPMMPGMGPVVGTDINDLRYRFDSVDADKSGSIEFREIHKVFNNPQDPMDLSTARMIVNLFSNSGSMNFDQFVQCDKFLKSFDMMFTQFDKNRNGRIEYAEFQEACNRSFPGLPESLIKAIFNRHIKLAGANTLSYSEMLAAYVFLSLVRVKFASWDAQRKGMVSLDLNTYITTLLWFM